MPAGWKQVNRVAETNDRIISRNKVKLQGTA